MADHADDPSTVPPGAAAGVTDEDRNRYGRLLDRAAERGLLDASDYEIRLRDLASASTIEQMARIVTELPAFSAAPPVTARTRPQAVGIPAAGARSSGPSPPRSSPWLLLVIVVVVVAASLVVLSVYAGHLVRNRNSGLAPAAVSTRPVSGPRP